MRTNRYILPALFIVGAVLVAAALFFLLRGRLAAKEGFPAGTLAWRGLLNGAVSAREWKVEDVTPLLSVLSGTLGAEGREAVGTFKIVRASGTRAEAKKQFDDSYVATQSLFMPSKAPYAGMISNQVVCAKPEPILTVGPADGGAPGAGEFYRQGVVTPANPRGAVQPCYREPTDRTLLQGLVHCPGEPGFVYEIKILHTSHDGALLRQLFDGFHCAG